MQIAQKCKRLHPFRNKSFKNKQLKVPFPTVHFRLISYGPRHGSTPIQILANTPRPILVVLMVVGNKIRFGKKIRQQTNLRQKKKQRCTLIKMMPEKEWRE